MQFKVFLLGFCLFSGLVYADLHKNSNQKTCLKNGLSEKKMKNQVIFLSSDSLKGRLTGTPGEKQATQYVANQFYCLGLEPAGDNGTFFQEFDFTAGVSFGTNNSLSITNQKGEIKSLKLDQEWRPLSFSDTTSFAITELVFAGYGISAPPLENLPAYNSYRDLNVKDKWVVVFRYSPEKISDQQSRHLNQYASPRYKAFIAKENGAKGIIFVSGPNAKVKNELIPLSLDTSLSGSGITALSVNDITLNELLKNSDHPFNSLKKLQDKLDLGLMDSYPLVKNIQITGHIDIVQNKKHGRNVLAKLKLGTNHEPMLVISAHIDHLGHGELSGSRELESEKRKIHYGADDNASGVVSVLAAASTLSSMKSQKKLHGNKDILFAIWSGEELGLLGSSHFVKNFMDKTKSKTLRPAFDANINLDMVGRLRKNLVLQGIGSSSNWSELIEQVNTKHPIPLVSQNDPYLPTDSTSFYLYGVPTLNFFTGSHDEYHTSHDTAETLNYQGIKNISEFLVDLILKLENESTTINYQHIAKTATNHRQGLRVYLGTIPDYTSSDILGVKLSGVTKNSPAEQAGIKQNDIVLELAGRKINDIYDYTFVLNTLHVGEKVPMVVLRGHKKLTMTLFTQSRG